MGTFVYNFKLNMVRLKSCKMQVSSCEPIASIAILKFIKWVMNRGTELKVLSFKT